MYLSSFQRVVASLSAAAYFTLGAQLASQAKKPSPYQIPGGMVQYPPIRHFTQEHVRLEIRPNLKARTVDVLTDLRLRILDPNAQEIQLDAIGLQILSAQMDGHRVEYQIKPEHLIIKLPKAYPYGAHVNLRLATHAKPKNRFVFVSPEGSNQDLAPWGQVWTIGSVYGHRQWFPAWHGPDVRSTTETIVHAPRALQVISNGDRVSDRPHGDKHIVHHRINKPHPLYLLSIAIGDFKFQQDAVAKVGNRRIPVGQWTPKVGPDVLIPRQRELARVMEYFSNLTGVPYPRNSYASVILRNHSGGMENTSSTFIGDQSNLVRPSSVPEAFSPINTHVHELAHSWFGGWVTTRSYADSWLNEGATSYLTAEGLRLLEGETSFFAALMFYRAAYFSEDETKYRRPVVTPVWVDPHTFLLDAHNYYGAAIRIHLIRTWLGEARFWEAVKLFFKRHGNSVAGTEDFREAIWDATGENLQRFFDAWIYGAGHPEVETEESWDAASSTWTLRIKQVQSEGRGTAAAFPFPLDVRFVSAQGERRMRFWVSQREHTFEVALAEKAHYVVLDDQMAVPMRLKRGRLEEDGYRQLNDPSPAARMLAWDELKGRVTEEGWAKALGTSLALSTNWFEKLILLRDARSSTAVCASINLRETGESSSRLAILALQNLAKADKGKAFSRANELLNSADPAIRGAALAVMGGSAEGRLQQEESTGLLRARLQDQSHADDIRKGAMEGLVALNPPDLTDLLLDQLSRTAAGPYLVFLSTELGKRRPDGDRIWPRLTSLLLHPYKPARESAARALGEIGALGAVIPLKAAIEDYRSEGPGYAPLLAAETSLKKLTLASEAKPKGNKP